MHTQRILILSLILGLSVGSVDAQINQKKRGKYTFRGYDSLNTREIWDIRQLSSATVYLCRDTVVSNVTSTFTGTGLIISHKGICFLVTAGHVAIHLKKNLTSVAFSLPGDMPGIILLDQITAEHNWRVHEIGDVALIQLTPKAPGVEDLLERIAFPSVNMMGIETVPNYFDVVFIGYPVIEDKMKHLSPINLTCKLASGLITQKASNDKLCTIFYLDRPSIQGMSGGGVFCSMSRPGVTMGYTNRTLLIGIMSGTRFDNTGGKLAEVMPTFYLEELLKGH